MHQTTRLTLLASALMLSFGSTRAQQAPTTTEPPAMAEAGGQAGPTANSSISRTTADTIQTSNSTLNLQWTGGRPLEGEAAANSSTTQTTNDNVTANLERSPNRALIESGAGEGASGNIGVNMAAGTGNLQGNTAAISSTKAQDVFATASGSSKQNTMNNLTFNVEDSSNDSILDAALSGSSGNIGVNVAAGAGNTQSNQLSMVQTAGSRVSRSSVAIDQSASSNQSQNASTYESTNSSNNAKMMTGALSSASGNIGVNVAAGVGNAQASSLSVSVGR